jgi:hypothetical protein
MLLVPCLRERANEAGESNMKIGFIETPHRFSRRMFISLFCILPLDRAVSTTMPAISNEGREIKTRDVPMRDINGACMALYDHSPISVKSL